MIHLPNGRLNRGSCWPRRARWPTVWRSWRGKGEAMWIGLALSPDGNWVLEATDIDLYDGLPGIALFFGYLGAVAGEARYTNMAKAAVTAMRKPARKSPRPFKPRWRMARSAITRFATAISAIWNCCCRRARFWPTRNGRRRPTASPAAFSTA